MNKVDLGAKLLKGHPMPKGAQHRPVAKEDGHVLLTEPAGTPNAGDPATAAARRVI